MTLGYISQVHKFFTRIIFQPYILLSVQYFMLILGILKLFTTLLWSKLVLVKLLLNLSSPPIKWLIFLPKLYHTRRIMHCRPNLAFGVLHGSVFQGILMHLMQRFTAIKRMSTNLVLQFMSDSKGSKSHSEILENPIREKYSSVQSL